MPRSAPHRGCQWFRRLNYISAAVVVWIMWLESQSLQRCNKCGGGEKSNGQVQLCKLVKVQFRGPELYKKNGALFQEESYLPRIFMSLSLNLQTFHLINIVFWRRIFFRKHGKSTPTIGKTTMFWSPTLWSWRHNAGARELSANQMLQSMTTTCR